MIDIQTTLLSFLPAKRKQTPSGWISFNSVCCHNRGETKDNRQRGGILFNSNSGFQYHCFNCNFKAGWNPGHTLSKNTKNLFKWLGFSDDDITKINLSLLKLKDNNTTTLAAIPNLNLELKSLPDHADKLSNWINDHNIQYELELKNILDYLEFRKLNINWYDWYWSPESAYKDRIIIPFYFENKIVGYTARKINNNKPKYLTVSQPGYVFNLDAQTYDKKFVIVVEGPIDAITIQAVAITHNEPNDTQCFRINQLNKPVIVVPDRDKAGAKLIKAALENNWSVSIPPWAEHIKDVADAVKTYGRLYTLYSILQYQESNKLKIELLKKKLETNG